MALLERRQYIPSMAGILLAQNRSGIIGVFIHEHEKYEGHTLEDFFISSSLNCLSAEIESNGQFMMVKRAKHAEEIIRFASMWNMDGIVVIGFAIRIIPICAAICGFPLSFTMAIVRIRSEL